MDVELTPAEVLRSSVKMVVVFSRKGCAFRKARASSLSCDMLND